MDAAEVSSLVISSVSFVVALTALVVAYKAWRRPFPPDPTSVPHFGTLEKPVSLDEFGRDFFKFLAVNSGRKVGLNAVFVTDSLAPRGAGPRHFSVPEAAAGEPMSVDHSPLEMELGPTGGRPGIRIEEGNCVLQGFFAVGGFERAEGDWLKVTVTPLTAVEAAIG